jgi:hypothetical protein
MNALSILKVCYVNKKLMYCVTLCNSICSPHLLQRTLLCVKKMHCNLFLPTIHYLGIIFFLTENEIHDIYVLMSLQLVSNAQVCFLGFSCIIFQTCLNV